MARATNTSASSVTLTISHYAASARSVCYTLPEALQALCTKNTSVYVKLSSLGGLVDKSGNIPATMAMGSDGFTPLSYCAVEALDVPSKAEFADNTAFYDAIRSAMGGNAPSVKPAQETIVRPSRTGGRTTVAPVRDDRQHTPPRRITGPATVAPSVKPLPVAAQETPENTRLDTVEKNLADMQADMKALLAVLTDTTTATKKGGKK